MKQIVILGNAPLDKDYSTMVDQSDFVVRFNVANNYGKFSGIKADALCMSQSGCYGRNLAKRRVIMGLPFIDSVKEIWFPRPIMHTARQIFFRSKNEKILRETDFSRFIIDRNKLQRKRIIYCGQALYDNACSDLNIPNRIDIYEPSSGYLAIKYALEKFDSDDTTIHIIGFTFQGFEGHPWEREKEEIKQLTEKGRLNFHACK